MKNVGNDSVRRKAEVLYFFSRLLTNYSLAFYLGTIDDKGQLDDDNLD